MHTHSHIYTCTSAQGNIFVERSHLLWKAPDALDLLARGAAAAADLAEGRAGGGRAACLLLAELMRWTRQPWEAQMHTCTSLELQCARWLCEANGGQAWPRAVRCRTPVPHHWHAPPRPLAAASHPSLGHMKAEDWVCVRQESFPDSAVNEFRHFRLAEFSDNASVLPRWGWCVGWPGTHHVDAF